MENPDNLREKVKQTTTSPGVYLMKDTDGKVIYVGKARNLRKRLASYFLKASPSDLKTGVLVGNVATFDTIITTSEQEALILESNLIKRHRPRYNIILKDDKRYPILRLDTASPFPMLTLVRKKEKDNAMYFGPFSSAGAVHKTMNLINRTFMLRKCKGAKLKPRSRPCLHFQMNRCLAPCCRDVDPARYQEIVREVILFLNAKTPDLISKIKKEMATASELQDYELAARLRDKIFALEKVLEKQVAVSSDMIDRDILGIARNHQLSIITLLFVRNGKLIGYRHFEFQETISTDAEMIGSFLGQYYERTPFIPAEILIPLPLDDAPLHEKHLSEYRGKKVRIHTPQRGEKVRMTAMAMENAANRREEVITQMLSGLQLLTRLKRRLSLAELPTRIECFDNSNLYGTNPVSGVVVFENGKPKKSAYRKYKIRNVSGPDDYAAMSEVLSRRFRKKENPDPLPDLLMVDGGKGQLNIAVSVLKTLDLYGVFGILGIAKKDPRKGELQDKIFLPERTNPVIFGKETDLLLFLQRIRDEAHRFAISFHRKKHRAAVIQSELDGIPGIGKIRKQRLLNHFGSVNNIRTAAVSEITAIPGFTAKIAKGVVEDLKKR